MNCLKPGHLCNSCLLAACKACSKKHHALLHHVRDTGTARQGVEQTHAAQTSSTTFMAVPVCAINGSVSSTGTGLLESASSTSYIRESFARTLGLIGEKRQLNAAVLGGNLVSGCREYVDMTVVIKTATRCSLVLGCCQWSPAQSRNLIMKVLVVNGNTLLESTSTRYHTKTWMS